jgi:hypothetical protein
MSVPCGIKSVQATIRPDPGARAGKEAVVETTDDGVPSATGRKDGTPTTMAAVWQPGFAGYANLARISR